MNRINKLFARKKSGILSIFFTAGFPKLDQTKRIAEELQKTGVDMIEIGIPFSDPIADGPVIQASNKIALDNGMSVKLLLEQVKEIRNHVEMPILLMGYLNPVLQFGFREFCKHAGDAGVDGLILPDMPLREYHDEYKIHFDAYNLSPVFLISPTTSEQRIRDIDETSNAFVYAVSASSTTGARSEFDNQQVQYFSRLREMKLKNPFLVGFGVSTAKTFNQVNQYASGAIVGSAFINMLSETDNLEEDISAFVKRIRG